MIGKHLSTKRLGQAGWEPEFLVEMHLCNPGPINDSWCSDVLVILVAMSGPFPEILSWSQRVLFLNPSSCLRHQIQRCNFTELALFKSIAKIWCYFETKFWIGFMKGLCKYFRFFCDSCNYTKSISQKYINIFRVINVRVELKSCISIHEVKPYKHYCT